MKLLVLGAGGIGGYFGGRLADAGVDVTFLVRPRRREQLTRDGLVIQSPLGDLRLSVKAVLAEELRPDFDLVLLTSKAYDLNSAMDAIAPAMQGHCAVLPLLNGISHLDILDERFGKPQVLGGVAQIAATLDAHGVIHHGDPLQRLIFGERDGSVSPRTQALAEVLGRTSIDWTLSTTIEQDLWEKIVFLSALAAATCLFRGNVGEINGAPGGREALERVFATNVEVATREGHPPRPAAIEFARKRLLDPAGTWQASMLRDLEAGARVEADHIVGWMLGKARAHGLDDTILSLAYTHLKTYERRRASRPDGQRTAAR
jgi:2-dehydropantoate 2-reductase